MRTRLSHNPVYNIKSVSEQTGIPPVTLRAWERRYSYPEPQRTDSGYRLYSEYDIAALNWLKHQTDGGMTIAQAVKLLQSLIANDEDPLVKGMAMREVVESGIQSIEQVQPALVKALLELDESESQRIMEYAFGLFTIDQVLVEIIQPTMIEIGDRWHSGEISVATEHFATHLCRLFLMKAYDQSAPSARKGSIVAACAPGELHDLGLLMLTIMLRENGWNVTYFGADLPLERFAETIKGLKPQLLLFSATTEQAALSLIDLVHTLDELPEPRPLIGLGGQAFGFQPALVNRIPGTLMGPDAQGAFKQIDRLLSAMVSA